MICQISEEEKTTIEYHTRISQIKTVIWRERQERAGISGSTLDDFNRPPYRLHTGLRLVTSLLYVHAE